jgi:Family of unknown function (DUF5908)
MALEINEIGIHFRVPDAERSAAGASAARRGSAGGRGGPCDEPDREQIVEDCVRRVLLALRALAER